MREMLHAFDVVGVHSYALMNDPNRLSAPLQRNAMWYMLRPWRVPGYKDDSDVGGVISQYPNLTYFFSEIGTFTHSDKGRTGETFEAIRAFYQMAADSGNVIGACPFIWHSGNEHSENRIWPNEELRGRLETMPRFATSAAVPVRGATPPPEPPPPPPPAPDGYAVGPGVLAAMTAEGDTPASSEAYIADGLSLTMGASGTLYAYTPPTGVVAYDPKAPGQ
jgi:hypothetical protein